jgi:hypothetical protein
MNIKQTVLASLGVISLFAGVLTTTHPVAALECGGATTSIISCTEKNGSDVKQTGVWALLKLVLNIMTAGVGILAVAGIVWGAILYTTASDKAEQTKKAITIITNVVIGIIAYALMFVIINFLIPGGLFKP